MTPEAYLLIRMVKKDANSKNKSLAEVRKIVGVKKADLTYGSGDIIIAEVGYNDSIESSKLAKTIEHIVSLGNVWVHEVYRKEVE